MSSDSGLSLFRSRHSRGIKEGDYLQDHNYENNTRVRRLTPDFSLGLDMVCIARLLANVIRLVINSLSWVLLMKW
jgi:hypothetical protein